VQIACAPAGAAVPDAGDLLARYDQSMGALRHSRITVVIREELAYSWKPSEWSLQEYTTERDERGRVRVTWRRQRPALKPGPQDRPAPQDSYTSTAFWDGRNYYYYDVTAPSTLARWKAEGQLDRLTPRQRAARAATLILSSAPSWRDEVTYMANLDPLNGVFPADRKIVSQIARAAGAKVDDRLERVGGVMCYAIEAKAPSGRYTLWIDPLHGHHIAAAEVRTSREDLYYGRPLFQPPNTAPVSLPADMPRGWQVENRFSLRGVEFRQVQGQWVPVRAEFLTSQEYEGDKRMGMVATVERTGVELDVHFERERTFVPHFPDGTPVLTAGGPEEVVAPLDDLVWRGGRAVHEPEQDPAPWR
jgi:hypothetical protein